MALFDRFRKKQDEVLPEEVENYYKSQKRAKVGTAWLLGFLTLIITLAVALALFYGGRYVYREFIDTDDETQEVTPADEAGELPGSTGQNEDESAGSTQNGGQTGNDTDNQSQQDQQSQESEEPSGSTSDNQQNQTLPANGDSLPSAGDPGR